VAIMDADDLVTQADISLAAHPTQLSSIP
jgi:hypothetical protein